MFTSNLAFRKEEAKHVFLRSPNPGIWRTESLGKIWLNMNEEFEYRKIINYANKTHKVYR
jgi:hypothetical protein